MLNGNIDVGKMLRGAGVTLICAITLVQGYVVEINKSGCPLDQSIDRLLEHNNCNKFYQCVNGDLVEQTCPKDLLFNIEIQTCDKFENVFCDSRLIPKNNGTDGGGAGGGGNNGTCNSNPEDAPFICGAAGSDGVLVAHENCDQFYLCSNGTAVAKRCFGSQLYNPYIERCDWPENVTCGDRLIPENNGSDGGGAGCGGNNGTCNCNPEDAPFICDAVGSDGVLVAHENCDQFYLCSNGTAVAMRCFESQLYNPYIERCDWPENVTCGDRLIPENNGTDGGGAGCGGNNGTCNCNPEDAPFICDAVGSDGVLVAHENCDQFYLCSNGTAVAMRCFESQLYNPYIERCDWPENVTCGDRLIPENNGTDGGGAGGGGNNGTCNCNPEDAPFICSAAGSDGVLVAHENCDQFYLCSNGTAVAMRCFGSQLYNPYIERCDWPENVTCGDRLIPENNGTDGGGAGGGGNNGTCNCNPEDAPFICSAAGSDGVLVAHENCDQFYLCSNGTAVAKRCFGSQLYNPYIDRCDWPENVTCGDRLIPENNGTDGGGAGGGGNNGTCNCNPEDAPFICGAAGSDGVLVAHENCDQFYLCSNGTAVAMRCFESQLYNPYIERCDWPENVTCGDRLIPENNGTDGGGAGCGGNNGTCNCNPEDAPFICDAVGSDGVLVAHENCDQFYLCSNGTAVAMRCFESQLYNPYIERCDWPENVTCGDRLIPENNGTDGGGAGCGGNNGTCNCNPEDAPFICDAVGSDGVLVAHENCDQFYLCSNGTAVAMRCFESQLYNPYIERCDWPENVTCGDRLIPENNGTDGGGAGGGGNNGTCNCNPEDAPFICSAAGSDGVLVAHENCDQFYLCSNGTAVAMRCFESQLYNPYIERCDWPENVTCGDRLIPENNGTDGGGAGGGGNNGTCNCNPEDAPFICSAAGSDGVLVAHENCDQFYLCSNGTAVAMRCFGSQLYNPYIERCDWPENVTCGDRLIPENNGTDGGGAGGGGNNGTCNCNPEDAPFICSAAGSDGVLVAHENCDQFYLCSNGTDVAKRCFGSQLYNPYIERCDWPENVTCGDRLIPENNGTDGGGAGGGGNNGTCNCNPEDAPFICGAAGSDGVLVAHENCDQFYLCSNGTAVAMRCFESQLYNPYIERCDWPENVTCGDRLIPENNGTDGGGAGCGGNNGTCNCNPEDAPFICDAVGSDGVLVAHENCDQFYLCSNGTAVAMRCFESQLYNPYIERCDWPENVTCGDRLIPENNGTDGGGAGCGGNNGTCNCNPEDAPFICDAVGSDGVLVAHENCDQFYLCSNGTAVAMRCFESQLYNPYIERCDWPENVTCGDRLIPENNGTDGGGAGGGGNNGTCNCNPEDAPFICSAAGSDGVLVAHENCDQFYLCSNGTAVAMRCFGSQLYNPYIERCDWPENVTCGDRLFPENNGTDGGGAGGGGNNGTCNCNPEDAPFICSAAGSDGVLVAHENCDQFYLCSNGTAVAKRCFGSQLYNPYIERCDWPENVTCGDRLIPENNGTDGGGAGGGGNNGTCNCNPEDAPFICGAAGSDGVLVAHENCDQFYLCSNGTAVAKRCFGSQLYNPYIERCDWPENVTCSDRLIPENNGTYGGGAGGGGNNGTCNCNPEDAPFICGAAGSDGVLVAHENCDQFY